MAEADEGRPSAEASSPPGDATAPPEASSDRFASLSPQERRLLNLVADGLTDKEIGDRLSMAERAVARYVEDILSKLGLQTRTQAILFAINRAFQATNLPGGSVQEDD